MRGEAARLVNALSVRGGTVEEDDALPAPHTSQHAPHLLRSDQSKRSVHEAMASDTHAHVTVCISTSYNSIETAAGAGQLGCLGRSRQPAKGKLGTCSVGVLSRPVHITITTWQRLHLHLFSRGTAKACTHHHHHVAALEHYHHHVAALAHYHHPVATLAHHHQNVAALAHHHHHVAAVAHNHQNVAALAHYHVAALENYHVAALAHHHVATLAHHQVAALAHQSIWTKEVHATRIPTKTEYFFKGL